MDPKALGWLVAIIVFLGGNYVFAALLGWPIVINVLLSIVLAGILGPAIGSAARRN